jgi:AraC-like DNA-binding protein
MRKPGAEVLWIARYDYRPSWELERHAHPYFQIFYFLGGRGHYYLDSTDGPIAKDLVVLVKPDQRHGLFAASSVKTLDIKFWVHDKGLLRALVRGPNLFAASDSEAGGFLGIADLLETIRREGTEKGAFFRDVCNAQLLHVLVRLAREGAKPKGGVSGGRIPRRALPDEPLVRRVKRYIEEHHAGEVSEPALAREAGFSIRHIRNRFTRELGTSPMRYLMHCRIEHAQQLIARSDYELKQIAELVGFKTVHHFTRVFGRIAGVPPGEYRNEIQRGIRRNVYISAAFEKHDNQVLPHPTRLER